MVALLGGASSCDNPLKDFNLQISTEVINNYATLRVVDIDGNNIPGVTATLSSGDMQDIYNMSGVKDFKLVDNLLTLGLDPSRTPTADNPVRFRVQFSAPGYNSQIIPVSITDASSGIQTVVLLKPTVIPDGAEETSENIDLSPTGSTLVETSIELPAANGKGEMSMAIPAGTQFKDASGNVIVGSNVQVTIASIDGENEDAVNLLPGGDLRSDAVQLAVGGNPVSGTFSPLAITNINMMVNGVEIRQFNQPIIVSMPVPSNYVNPSTGQPIAAGDIFQIFSNSGDGVWRFEQNSTITGSAATGYQVSFPVSHLTFFMAAQFGQSCSSDRSITFQGDWMNNGTTAPIQVDVIWGSKVIYTGQYSINQTNNRITVSNIPAAGAKIVVRNQAGNFLAESKLADCQVASTIVQLPNPSDAGSTTSTLQLYVRCPDKTNVITLLPTFQMFYRESGTSEYKFLGTVNNGLLRTTLLKTNGTEYDFKAIWGERIKEVLNHTVTVDNTATVGLQAGDIMGTKAGATNLAILTEECNKL